MSYAATAAAGGRRQAPAINPLRHLAHLQGFALLIDLKSAKQAYSKEERYDFVIKELGIPAREVLSIFVDHITQLLVLTVETEETFDKALERLQDGVPWAAAGDVPVYGSSSSEAVTAVRVSNLPHGLPVAYVLNFMKKFGIILNHHMGRDRLFPRASDGILHITMVLSDAENLPHFIQVVDNQGRLSNSLPVHMDAPRRRCYRCGRSTHPGFMCHATSRVADAPAAVWCNMVAPPAPVKPATPPAQQLAHSQTSQPVLSPVSKSEPPPIIQVNPDQTGGQKAAEKAAQMAAQEATDKEEGVDSAEVDMEMGPPPAPAVAATRKRPLAAASSALQTSSSSECEEGASARVEEKFIMVTQGRRQKKKRAAAEATAARDQQQEDQANGGHRVPLATPVPKPSTLEKVILTPEEEEGPKQDGGDSGGT